MNQIANLAACFVRLVVGSDGVADIRGQLPGDGQAMAGLRMVIAEYATLRVNQRNILLVTQFQCFKVAPRAGGEHQ